MAVQVYGCNHVVIEVDDAQKAVEFYSDVFNLEMLRGGEGAAWCKLGEHQFLAIFEVETLIKTAKTPSINHDKGECATRSHETLRHHGPG